MKYFRYHWNESRGDEFSNWGNSIWLVEVGDDNYAVRQMEIYENGNILKYDSNHFEDNFGFLGDQKIENDENELEEISFTEFEKIWKQSKSLNN
jgi:hypothetical protein